MSGPNTYDELRHHAQELQAMNDELGVATKVGIPPERRPLDSPIVLDTDIGGDADDAIAVSAAAADPHLTLVVTSDETPDGSRARFVRLLLDQLGRRDVRVIQGAALSTKPYSSIDHIDTQGAQPDDVGLDAIYSAVQTLLTDAGTVRWVGMAPMTNLADVLTRLAPEQIPRLDVTQMGFAINYRDPDRAEHNVRLDVDAARTVLEHAEELTDLDLVLSDITFTPELELGPDHRIAQAIAAGETPWARTMHSHLTGWFDNFYPSTIQHDALALSVALALPFVRQGLVRAEIDEIGRLSKTGTDDGYPVFVSYEAYYEAFWQWLEKQLPLNAV